MSLNIVFDPGVYEDMLLAVEDYITGGKEYAYNQAMVRKDERSREKERSKQDDKQGSSS